MVSDLKLVIRLQDLDNRIRDLQKEVTSLPKHIALIEKTLDSKLRKLEADRAALAANQRERKRLEGDIQAQEQKISKLRDQMLQAKTNEQYAAFRHEIEFCEAEIHKHEDGILEQMAESEPLVQNVKAAETELAKEKQQVEAEKNVARETTARHKRQLEELKKERAGIASSITPAIYTQYTRLRTSRKGVAVAEALDGACSACHMALRLQFFQDLRLSDQVMFCESCGRIIYYTPPPVESDENGPGAAESQAVESNR
ncbi:MAG TPA: C4-type zinc ribbon domain-containing protein [Bryobacteraceae bacterium]|nr:C4-type zinc ribbon domain-containing protein [Bryobacteraceae bacterium]